MSLTLDLAKATKNIKEKRDKVVKGTIFKLSSLIIKGTPVGEPSLWASPAPEGYVGGTLRGAWNASLNSADRAITNAIDKAGDATVADVLSVVNRLDIGETFYLTNPQPYAYPIEFTGWSSQAPAGMVRINVKKAQSIIKGLAK